MGRPGQGATEKHSDLVELRREIVDALTPLAPSERQRWLKRELAATSPGTVRDGFLCQYLLNPFFALPPKTAQPLIKRCLGTMTRLADANRLNKRFLRDAQIAIGNYWSQRSEDRKALASYRAALDGESDPDRRGVALLNVAKLHVAASRYHEALATAGSIDLRRLKRDDVREALRLLRVRALMVLGADDEAIDSLAETRGKSYGNPRVDLERRYLGLVGRHRAADPAALAARADDFLAWLAARGDEATTAFYELEILVIRRVAAPEAIKNRARMMTRAQYLAKKSGASDLYRLLKALDPVLWSKRATAAQQARLEDAMTELGDSAHHLLFQTVALLAARHFVARRQWELAAAHLTAFADQRRRLRASFGEAALTRLDARANRTGELADALISALPEPVVGRGLRAARLLLG